MAWLAAVLLAALAAGLVQFVFNPLGLGPRPARALPARFFSAPAADLSTLALAPGGRAAFEEILRRIGSAREAVHVQTFIWRDDGIGRRVAETLVAAGERGVEVTARKDALGTFFELGDIIAGRPSPAFTRAGLRGRRNVHVTVDPIAANDHSKYYIFDHAVVIFGGMNIGDEYHTQWRDYMALITNLDWARAFEGAVLRGEPWPFDGPVFLAVNDRTKTQIAPALIEVMDAAREELLIEHAYVSYGPVLDAIARAANRGVRVALILPARPDTHHYANMAAVNRLLAAAPANLSVWLYPGMTHAKVMLADRRYAVAGSANFTPRSMVTTREAALFVHGGPDEPFLAALAANMEEARAASAPVTAPFSMGMYERAGAVVGKYIW